MVSEGPGGPFGASARAGNYVVTMIQTQEARLPSIPPHPEDDRYRISLVLHSVDGRETHMAPIADGRKSGDYIHAARFLGDDGQRIWFHAHEPLAYDYRAHKLIRQPELSRWTEPPQRGLFPRTEAKDFQEPAERMRAQYLRARFVLEEASGKQLRLSEPNGVLMTYWSKPGVEGSVALARLKENDEVVWKVETGLGNLEQILPDAKVIALIGTPAPKSEIDVPAPTLVLIDTKTGAQTRHTLWIKR